MVGFNGTGKTTVLEIIYNILSERFEYFLKYNQFTYIELVLVQDNEDFKIRVEKIEDSIGIKLNDKVVNNLSEYLKSAKIIYVPTEVNFLNIETKGVNKLSGVEDQNIILDSERMSKQLKQFLVNEKYNDLNDIAEGNPEKATRIDKFKVLYNNFFEDKEFIGIDNQIFEPQFQI